jgi:hypothetical protein
MKASDLKLLYKFYLVSTNLKFLFEVKMNCSTSQHVWAERRVVYRILVRKPEGNRSRGRPKRR